MPSARGPVRVLAPATSANLGPGFDSAGLCLALHDEVEVDVVPAGLHVEVTGEGAGTLPMGESHLVVRALRAAFALGGGQPPGLRVRCVNRLPQSRGLGSSSAAIVAGLVAARALRPGSALDDDGVLLTLADRLEGHPDNVAACLRGGFTLAWAEGSGADRTVRVVRRDPHPGLAPVVLVPAQRASTAQVRGLLPETVPHADAAANAARAALLALAVTVEPSLLLPATVDRLHQEQRAPAMRQTARVVAQLRGLGLPAVVSGAGPTVLVLTQRDQVDAVLAVAPPGWRALPLAVDLQGARVVR